MRIRSPARERPRRSRAEPSPIPSAADRDRLWLLGSVALFCLAALWRFAYLARLRDSPFANSLDADSRIYWHWSETILRHGLMPSSAFYLAPLYPYALAAWRAAGAGALDHVLAIQALMGSAAVVLLADATRRLAGRAAAFVIGVVLALFQVTTFFDSLVLPESLLFFAESMLVWLVARSDWSRAGAAPYAVLGLLIGVITQARASHAVLMALVVPLVLALPSTWAHRLRMFAVAFAAFAACCFPSALANVRASHEFVPFTYNLGFNLYVGNNPDADGGYVDIVQGSTPVPLEGTSPTTGGALDGRAFVLATEGRRLSPAESSAYWTSKAARFVRSAPIEALGLAGKKLLLEWNCREIPQIESMRSFAQAAGPLGLPLIGTFGFMAILGLSGIPWAAPRGMAERSLVLYVLLVSLAMVPFFVTDRYRLHLLPALAVLAGISLAELGGVARRRAAPALLRWVLPVALATAVVCAPVRVRHSVPDDWTYVADRAIRLLDRGSFPAAVESFALAERSLGDAGSRDLPPSARIDLAAFYFRYAIALESVGREADAILRWERAVALNPNDVGSLGRLSLAYELAGRASDEARVRRRLASTPGGRGQLLLIDGWSAAARGDLAGAERRFLAALQATPDLSMAWDGLIRLRIQTGRFADASRALDQARCAGLDLSTADVYECFLDVQRGDLAAARRIMQRISAGFSPRDPFLSELLDHAHRALAMESRPR